MRTYVLLIGLCLAIVSCGGVTTIDHGLADGATDSSAPGDGAADGAVDGMDGADDHDGGGLPTCRHDQDCEGTATCQQGYCCRGIFHDGQCWCGAGPGCDVLHICCYVDGGYCGTFCPTR